MPDDAIVTSDSGGNTAAPATFEQAFAADASPASDPTPQTSDAPPAVEAASGEVVAGQPGTGDGRSQQIPRQRFDEVNTRLNDLKAQWESPGVQAGLQFFQQARQDPRAFALQLLDELAASPDHGQAIRSELARRLGTRPQAAAPVDAMPQPDVAITDGAGNIVGHTFSDTLLAKRDEFLRRQMLQEVDAKYAPHVQTLQQIREERQRQQHEAQATQFAGSFVTELKALPLFAEHQADIGRALKAQPLESDHPDAVRAAAYRAYHQIVGPKLKSGMGAATVADLQRKAHASTAVNPTTAGRAAVSAPTSFFDPRLEW